MELEDQVCSLDLAKNLKELGVKQESLFSWCKPQYTFSKEKNHKYNEFSLYINKERHPSHCENKEEGYNYLTMDGCGCCEDTSETGESYSAFTIAELGEILPKIIHIKTEEEDKKIFSNFRLVTGRSIIIEDENPVEIWSVNYICDTTNEFRNFLFDSLLTKPIYDKKEVDARAKMLIYLIENDLFYMINKKT